MLEISYGLNSITKEYTFYEKEIIRDYPIAAYLKFYPENKVGLFLIKKPDTLNLKRYLFNPQNAKMGYYYIEGNRIFTKITDIQQCEFNVIKSNGKISNDTIEEFDHNGGNIYVKKNIPKEYIEKWKPDW